jgi:hypothetical protein
MNDEVRSSLGETVSRIWKAFGLKPWEIDEFKISPDPQLVALLI